MKSIFDENVLGGVPVRNRLVRSATLEFAAEEDGDYTRKLSQIYERLAEGGVGTVITGVVGVDGECRLSPKMINACDGRFEPALREWVQTVHRYGSRLVVQIGHSGVFSKTISGNLPPMAVYKKPGIDHRQMTADDIRRVAERFAHTARKCRDAGADAVQLHAAHGYLLNQFLSPLHNQRTDEYGGSLENRARALFEVYDAIREAVGDTYPIWIKINSSDLVEGGFCPEECLWVCKQLSDRGLAAIEVSGGNFSAPECTPSRRVRGAEEEGYFLEAALRISEQVSADVISVGGYRTPEVLERCLNTGGVKAIAVSRPFIAEPELAGRWESGDRAKARCVSCNKCYKSPSLGCPVFGGEAAGTR